MSQDFDFFFSWLTGVISKPYWDSPCNWTVLLDILVKIPEMLVLFNVHSCFSNFLVGRRWYYPYFVAKFCVHPLECHRLLVQLTRKSVTFWVINKQAQRKISIPLPLTPRTLLLTILQFILLLQDPKFS